MKAVIIGASGEINEKRLLELKNNFIICADGGVSIAKKLGIEPHLVVGDFDSIECEMPTKGEVITFLAEKDDTDTLGAIKEALSRGYKELYIFGGTGGKRLDHTIANISALAYIWEQGGIGEMISPNESIFVLEGDKEIINTGDISYVSLFPLDTQVEGVSLTGFKYSLNNYTLKNTIAVGVSNEIKDAVATIKTKKGKLILVVTKI